MVNVFRDGRQMLFEGLIDYAGLFPPASLDMQGAVDGYREARGHPAAWLLGAFICPASRLEDLARHLTGSMQAGEAGWPVSVLVDVDPVRAGAMARDFHAELEPAAGIALLEARLPNMTTNGIGSVEQFISTAVRAASSIGHVAAFFEGVAGSGWRDRLEPEIDAIRNVARIAGGVVGAKLRCGGATADSFPTPEQVARFIVACRDAAIPWKATAGLHHPLRHADPDLGVMRHGFLNLLTAAAAAEDGADLATVVDALEDTDPGAFRLGATGLTWATRSFTAAALRALRRDRLASYGSCSFLEPVEDLSTLGFLPAIAPT